VGPSKVPTILLYDDKYKNVQSWGFKALDEFQSRKVERTHGNGKSEGKLVELYEILLGKMENEPPLPCEKAITDYLHKLGKAVKEEIFRHWESIDFYKNVLIVLTVNNFNIL
jgi:hypothetical protein